MSAGPPRWTYKMWLGKHLDPLTQAAFDYERLHGRIVLTVQLDEEAKIASTISRWAADVVRGPGLEPGISCGLGVEDPRGARVAKRGLMMSVPKTDALTSLATRAGSRCSRLATFVKRGRDEAWTS